MTANTTPFRLQPTDVFFFKSALVEIGVGTAFFGEFSARDTLCCVLTISTLRSSAGLIRGRHVRLLVSHAICPALILD